MQSGNLRSQDRSASSPPDLLVLMEGATVAIRRALGGLEPYTIPAFGDFFDAFAAVQRVTERRRNSGVLNSRSGVNNPLFNRAIAEYRYALLEWDRQLPRIHGWLLTERARLEERRAHAAGVDLWLKADRQTRRGPAEW